MFRTQSSEMTKKATGKDVRSQSPPMHLPGSAHRAGGSAPATIVAQAAHATPIQARWVIDSERKVYFWEEDGTDRTDAPSTLTSAGYNEVGAPSPGTYTVDSGPRGRPLYYSLEQWTSMHSSSSSPASHDIYNPFGRFDTGAAEVAFIPSPKFSDAEAATLVRQLDEKIRTLQTIKTRGPGGSHGYPKSILSTSDTVLYLIGVSEFGALYGPPAKSAIAQRDPRVEESVALLRIVEAAPEFKIVENRVTQEDVRYWEGRDRERSQVAVMGSSAADVAENAGYDRNEGLGWEWLHLIAHSMGGVEYIGPQVASNLVVGTSECNTQMIVVEEWIKAVIVGGGHRARMWVGAKMIDPKRHIADRIVYDFVILDDEDRPIDAYHWEFNPLSRHQPIVEENQGLRYAARTLLIGKTGKDVSGKGRIFHEAEHELNWAGYRVGEADGSGNMCLLDTLSQLLQHHGHNVSVDGLVAFFANAGVVQLGQMIDVYNVNVTGAIAAEFNVQVQVHQAQYYGILDHPVVGDNGPVLHIYHAGAHFSPLWPGEAPELPPDTGEYASNAMDVD
jgi:hypothetical protein